MNVVQLGTVIDGNTSDGYHTFNELYHHRAVLFSVIVHDHKDQAWKSLKHYDGSMYDGMFIVGINTPSGQATYHYDIDPYWNMFDCKELEHAPEWDGHTPEDAIERIGQLAMTKAGDSQRDYTKEWERRVVANAPKHETVDDVLEIMKEDKYINRGRWAAYVVRLGKAQERAKIAGECNMFVHQDKELGQWAECSECGWQIYKRDYKGFDELSDWLRVCPYCGRHVRGQW